MRNNTLHTSFGFECRVFEVCHLPIGHLCTTFTSDHASIYL